MFIINWLYFIYNKVNSHSHARWIFFIRHAASIKSLREFAVTDKKVRLGCFDCRKENSNGFFRDPQAAENSYSQSCWAISGAANPCVWLGGARRRITGEWCWFSCWFSARLWFFHAAISFGGKAARFDGAAGIIAGMRLLRHKTRKAAFYLPVWGILLLQSVLIIAFPKLLIAYY